MFWQRDCQLGAADYLVKPITEGELLGALERVRRNTEVRRVLIVDDEPINVLVVQESLRLAGYQNTLGEMDATKALDRIAKEQPDIVLIDIMMPEVNGLEILEKPNFNLGIVVLVTLEMFLLDLV